MMKTGILEEVFMRGTEDALIVFRMDEQGIYYYELINEQARQLTGLSNADLGREFTEKVPGISRVFLYQKFQEVLESGEPTTFEMSYRTHEYDEYTLSVTLRPVVLDEEVYIVVNAKEVMDSDQTKSEWWVTDQNLELSRQRYRSLFENNQDAIFSLNREGVFLEVNKAFELLSGYDKDELIGVSAFSIIDKRIQRLVKKYFLQTIRGKAQSFEITIQTKSTQKKEIQVMTTPLEIEKKIVGIYVIMKDVSEQRKAEREQKESEERFRMIAESSHDLITLLDHDGNILYASPSYEFILGFPPEEYIGKSLLHNIYEADQKKIISEFLRSINENRPISLEFKQLHAEKGWLWFELQGKPIFDSSGGFIHMVVVTRDISERKRYEEKLREFAYQDPLTNLPNRRYFQERLSTRLEEARKRGKINFAVIMMDLDNLKKLNDQQGHDFGDEALRIFSRRALNSLRSRDIIARLGGDEFIILLDQIESKKDCIDIIHRLQNRISEPARIKNKTITLTASIGLTAPTSLDITEEKIIKQADMALYTAKAAGKNTYEVLLSDDEEI